MNIKTEEEIRFKELFHAPYHVFDETALFTGNFRFFASLVKKNIELLPLSRLVYAELPEGYDEEGIIHEFGKEKIIKDPSRIAVEMCALMHSDQKIFRDGKVNLWLFILYGELWYVSCCFRNNQVWCLDSHKEGGMPWPNEIRVFQNSENKN
ncbi:MAG: hypothetical protein PHC89_02730 [Candidatus Pacebacteria bacterium]|nr:hypothetical protein [Candidatus Paceibacterota bacterium]